MKKCYRLAMKVNVRKSMACLIVLGILFVITAGIEGYARFGERIAYFIGASMDTKLELMTTLNLTKSDYLYLGGVSIVGLIFLGIYGVLSLIYMIQRVVDKRDTVKRVMKLPLVKKIITSILSERTCPSCGSGIREMERYCKNCGSHLIHLA